MTYRNPILPAFAVAALAVAPAAAETVTVTESECAGIVAHVPDDSVAYKPGVSVDGRAVAPADLNGRSFTVEPPDSITIDIKIDPDKLPASAGRYLGEATAGKVEIRNGKIFYNGAEIDGGIRNEIAEACKKLRAGKK